MLELSSNSGVAFRCTITNSGAITLLLGGKTYNVSKSHHNYDSIKKAIAAKDVESLTRLLNTEKVIRVKFEKVSPGKVEVKNGQVLYQGQPIHNTLTGKILDFIQQGLPFHPLVRFLENLMDNPSKRAVDELYNFLTIHGIPLTEDGCFLSYKSVRSDYYDKYSGTILNKPGTVVEVPRNSVDDDCNKTCSHGIHTGALGYAGPGGWYNREGDKVVVVKVNPRDAVSVPTDHDMQKLRVCRYEVVRDFDEALDKPLYQSNTELNEIKEYSENYEDDLDDMDGNCNDDYPNPFDYCKTDTTLNYKYQKRDKSGRFVKN